MELLFLREGFRGSQVGKCYMGCWMEMDQGRTEEEAGKRGLRRLEARWMGNEKRAEVGEVILLRRCQAAARVERKALLFRKMG